MHFEINLKGIKLSSPGTRLKPFSSGTAFSALSHSFWHMAQYKFPSCKSQPGMFFNNTLQLKQGQLVLQGLTGCRSSPAEVSLTFHVCKEVIWFLCCLFFPLRIQGMAENFQKKKALTFAVTFQIALPSCWRLQQALAEGCSRLLLHGLCDGSLPRAVLFGTQQPEESCKTGGWQEPSTQHWAIALYKGRDSGKGRGSWFSSLWEHLFLCILKWSKWSKVEE